MSVASTHAGSGRLGSRGLVASEVAIADALAGYRVPDARSQLGLAREVATGDGRARDEMVVANLRLVLFWARRYEGRGVELADLFQEGAIGLMRAVELYDAGRGTRFSTYASWRIRSRMQAAVLGAARWSGDDPRLGRALSSIGPGESVDEAVVHTSVVAELRRAVDGLDALGRRVVSLRFGLDGNGPLSLNDTAQRLHLGSRRIREIETEVLSRLALVLDGPSESPAHEVVGH